MIFSPLFSLRRRARLFARSSAVVAALFSLVLGTTAFAADAATAPISPFINKDTLVVARVSLDNVDFDRLAQTLDGVVATSLKNAGYNAASVEKVGAELDKTFAALAQDAKDQLAQLRQKVGASEAFFVLQSAKGEGAAFLVPVEKLSDAQRESLTASAKEFGAQYDFDAAVYQKRWLVVAADLKAFGSYYKNFKPGENRKIDAFFKTNADAAVAAYCGTLRLRPLLDVATKGQTQLLLTAAAPRSVRDALEIFDTSFVEARLTVDAGTLAARAAFRFNAPVDSGKMLTALQRVVDDFAKVKFDASDASDLEKKFNLVPLQREIWRGLGRAQLPKQNGAELVAEYDFAKESAKTVAFGPALVAGALYWLSTQNAEADAAKTDAEIDFEFDEIETEPQATAE